MKHEVTIKITLTDGNITLADILNITGDGDSTNGNS